MKIAIKIPFAAKDRVKAAFPGKLTWNKDAKTWEAKDAATAAEIATWLATNYSSAVRIDEFPQQVEAELIKAGGEDKFSIVLQRIREIGQAVPLQALNDLERSLEHAAMTRSSSETAFGTAAYYIFISSTVGKVLSNEVKLTASPSATVELAKIKTIKAAVATLNKPYQGKNSMDIIKARLKDAFPGYFAQDTWESFYYTQEARDDNPPLFIHAQNKRGEITLRATGWMGSYIDISQPWYAATQMDSLIERLQAAVAKQSAKAAKQSINNTSIIGA